MHDSDNSEKLIENLQLQVEKLTIINKIQRIIYRDNHSNKIKALTNAILKEGKEKLLCDRVSLIVKKPSEKKFIFIDAIGISKKVLDQENLETNNNVLSFVLKHKTAVVCNNIVDDERFGISKKLRYKSLAFLVVPMISNKEVKGFICATENQEGKLFTGKDVELCEALAKQFMEGYFYLYKEEIKKSKK